MKPKNCQRRRSRYFIQVVVIVVTNLFPNDKKKQQRKQQPNHSRTHATNKKWIRKLCTGIYTRTHARTKRRNVNRIQTSHIFGRDINYFFDSLLLFFVQSLEQTASLLFTKSIFILKKTRIEYTKQTLKETKALTYLFWSRLLFYFSKRVEQGKQNFTLTYNGQELQ